MARTIEQTVAFPASPERLYRIYLSAREHAAACGWGRARITPRIGGGMALAPHISGKFLQLVPGRMIVQTWRGADRKKSEPDSVLILSFGRARGGARLEMIHANVPNVHATSIAGGWRSYYWKPWKAYLKKSRRSSASSRGVTA